MPDIPEDQLAGPKRKYSFGDFVVDQDDSLLLRNSQPVRIGSRSLQILNVLVERPGELVSKDEFVARVWPNLFVEESNLMVNVAGSEEACTPQHF